MPSPLLLLGAGRQAAYGEFPLARIAAVHPVVLVGAAPPAWALPLLAGHLVADPDREADTAGVVARFAARQRVAGVLTWSREHLVTAARVAGQLGLPGLPHETAPACADPAALRTLLARHGVPPAGRDDLEGPLVAAEAVVHDEDVHIVAITRTTPGPPPARQPLRHIVYAHDGLLHNPFLRQAVERTGRALGLTHGVLHVELRVTPRGPRVIGVTPCLPGDLIPLLVERATGVDLARAAAAVATGGLPDVSLTRQRAAAIQFAYPAATGRLTHLALAPAAAQEPSAERMVLSRQPGGLVRAASHADASDRLAHWVVVGADPGECEGGLRGLAVHLSATVSPPSRTFAA